MILCIVGGAYGQEKITINLWHTFSLAEIQLLNQMIEEYEKINPNIDIVSYEIPHQERDTKVPMAVQTGDVPDILRADYPYQYYLAGIGQALPLDEYLEGWDGIEDIFPVLWDDVTFNGKIYAVPQDGFSTATYYNVDHFEKAGIKEIPKNWEEFAEACKKLTVDLNGDGTPDQYGYGMHGKGLDVTLDYLRYLAQAGGAIFEGDNYTPEAVIIDNEAGVQALKERMVDLYKMGVCPPGTPGYGYGEVDDAFKSEKVSMYECGTWNIANYAVEVPKLNYNIMPLPAGPAGYATSYDACFYTVFQKTPCKNECVEFIKWLTSKENVSRWSKELVHEPVRQSVMEDSFFTQHPKFQAFVEMNPYKKRLHPKLPSFAAIDKAINTNIQEALLGNKTPEVAVKDMAEEIKKVVSR